jgi:hypothetical protein
MNKKEGFPLKANLSKYVALLFALVALLPISQNTLFSIIESFSIEQVGSGTYDWTKDRAPIKIGSFETFESGKLRMKYKFKIDDSNLDYPNLFQTSDVNFGIRAEISNGSANGSQSVFGIVYSTDSAGTLQGVTLSEDFKFGVEHELILEAKQNKFISATFDGDNKTIISPPPVFRTDNLLIGQGFNPERSFTGEISKFDVVYIPNEQTNKVIYFVINGVIIGLILGLFFRKGLRFRRFEN